MALVPSQWVADGHMASLSFFTGDDIPFSHSFLGRNMFSLNSLGESVPGMRMSLHAPVPGSVSMCPEPLMPSASQSADVCPGLLPRPRPPRGTAAQGAVRPGKQAGGSTGVLRAEAFVTSPVSGPPPGSSGPLHTAPHWVAAPASPIEARVTGGKSRSGPSVRNRAATAERGHWW